jgi:hypothetical protein
VNNPLPEQLIQRFIADSSPYVPLLGVSDTHLENGYYQASYHQHSRLGVVLRLVAQGFVLVAVLASGWWGMRTLGSHALASESSEPPALMADPVYVAGCPVGDRPENGSVRGEVVHRKGWGCSEEGGTHPISTRKPGAGGVGEHAHRGAR